jgi:hypothetical protein
MNIFAISLNIISKVRTFANIIVSIQTITNTMAAKLPLGMEHQPTIQHHGMYANTSRTVPHAHEHRVSKVLRGFGDVYLVFTQGQFLLASISHS